MLKIFKNQSSKFCDGVNRRDFLQIGGGGLGALSLPSLLRAESNAGVSSSNKAVIHLHLNGGPSHQDMFDLKPDAPSEYRGEFNPISTSVPGIQICEHLPKLAKRAKDYAIIRGLTHTLADHGIGKKYLLTGNRPSQTLSYPE